MTGTVLNVQRFCTDDGPGIRTTVFLKGCPLRCLWCHNPESQSAHRELMYSPDKCAHCLRCVAVCPAHCHEQGASGHEFHRATCVSCGQCAELLCDALETAGDQMTADAVMEEVLKDRAFYESSGGGLTLSGGEPLLQAKFTVALLKRAKEEGLHTCMETCGFADPSAVAEAAPLVDLFLFDYKESDPVRHKAYTGADPTPILNNLRLIDSFGRAIALRCPIIPGYNDRPDHFEGIARVANTLSHITEITVEPYHALGESKYKRLDRPYDLAGAHAPDRETVTAWITEIQKHTTVPVRSAIG